MSDKTDDGIDRATRWLDRHKLKIAGFGLLVGVGYLVLWSVSQDLADTFAVFYLIFAVTVLVMLEVGRYSDGPPGR